jgi:PKD repeat protein
MATHIYSPSEDYTATYPVLGTYTARVTATNDYNQMTAATVVQVLNDEPEVDVSGLDQIAFEDELVHSGFVTFKDINRPDSHTAVFDWGDGTVTAPDEFQQTSLGGWFEGSHIYQEPGVYLVTVIVRDRYGGVGVGTFTITVIHGFMRYCGYATGGVPGVSVGAESVLDCGWNAPGPMAGISTGGLGSRYHIQTGAGVVITGNLSSQHGKVILGPDAILLGEVISSEYEYLSVGHIGSGGDVILSDRSTAAGNVTSRSDVELWPGSFVGGDVTAAGQVEVASSAEVSGTIDEGANVAPIPPISPVEFSFSAAKGSVVVRPGETLELPPGKYGTLQVREGAALRLSAGRYTFEWIQVKKEATIEFDLGDGWINIDVVKNVDMLEGVTMAITSDEGQANDILFRIMGQSVNLHQNGLFLGTFVAPSANVQMGEGSELTGALYGRKVDLKERSRIVGMPARDLFALIQLNPEIGNSVVGMALPLPATLGFHTPLIQPKPTSIARQSDYGNENSSLSHEVAISPEKILQNESVVATPPADAGGIVTLGTVLILGLYFFRIPGRRSSRARRLEKDTTPGKT